MDVEHIAVMGDRAVVPQGDGGLLLIDVSDESTPRIIAQCPAAAFKRGHQTSPPWSTGAIVAAQTVRSVTYVADYRGYIYGISYPRLESPKVLAQTYFGRGLHVSDGRLWRITLDGLIAFDL